MGYLGREPTNTGEFLLIDDISSNFDGSEVNFTLQVGLLDITPAAANTVIALDGVLQEPTTAYTISGSTITFTGAPDSGLSFYGVLAGQSQYISNSSITNEHISAATSISGSKINTDFSAQNIQITHITASGNISASGIVIADTFQSTGGSVDGISFTDDLNITGNITASGEISSSGNLSSTGNLDIDGTSNLQGNVTLQNDLTVNSNVTASGNISGSATSTGSFGQLVISNDGDIALIEDQRIYFEADKATYIESNNSDAFRIVAGDDNMLILDQDTGKRAVFGNGVKVFIGANNNQQPTSELEVKGTISGSGILSIDGNMTASGNISSSASIIGNTFTGTFNGALSSSAQIAASISGSRDAASISGSLGANAGVIRTLSAATVSGSFGNQRVGTTDDVKFANITGSNDISASGNLSITGNVDVDGTSNFSGNVTLQNDLVVTGRIDAEEIHTTFISSSITQATGSNLFGDSTTDSHQFTGSVDISGSLRVSDGNVVVSDTLTATNIGAFTAAGAIDFNNENMTNVDIDSGNIDAVTFGSTTKSMISGSRDAASISGSRDAASISGSRDAASISGSFGNQRVGTTDDVKFANITGSNNISASGNLLITGNISGSSNLGANGDLYIGGNVTASGGFKATGVSLSNNDAGTSNTIFGKNTAADLDAGSNFNVFIGEAVSTGSMNDAINNVGIGYEAMKALTSGDNNVVIGKGAGVSMTTAADNIIIGEGAGDTLTAAMNNHILIGRNAGAGINSTDANGTIAIGYQAGKAITSGQKNVAIGFEAQKAQTTGDRNTVIGYSAMQAADGGEDFNTVIGSEAGYGINNDASHDNVIIGKNALQGGTGTILANVAIGSNALTGVANNSQTGTVAIGYSALGDLTTGVRNTGVGYTSIYANTTGADNTALGYGSLSGLNHVDGDHNTAVGVNGGSNLVSGYQNTFIGSNTQPASSSTTNSATLGYAVTAVASNSVTLGNASVTAVYAGSDSGAVVHAAGMKFDNDQTNNIDEANTLDDYEEGTQVVTLGMDSGTLSLVGGKNEGQYTKIGRMVHYSGEISCNGASSPSGTLTLTLPFTVSDITDLAERTVGTCSLQNCNFTDTFDMLHVNTYAGQSVMTITAVTDNAGWNNLNANTWASGTEMVWSISYISA